MNAPRCQFHVAVEMVPIARPPQKSARNARKGTFRVTPIAQQDMQQPLVPGELGDIYLARQAFRCPVVGCPCVSQLNPSAEIASGVPKCRQCGKPALWFPLGQKSLCRRCTNKSRLGYNRQYNRKRRSAVGERIVAAAVVFLLLALSAPAHAGPLSPLKFFGKTVGRTFTNFVTWRDPARNLVYLGYAAAIALDLHSTSYFVARCPSCIEMTNPLIGRRPSNRALALDGAGEFLFTTTLSTSILENRHIPKPFKFIPYAALGTFAIGHIDAAHSNYQLPKLHATPIQPAQPAR